MWTVTEKSFFNLSMITKSCQKMHFHNGTMNNFVALRQLLAVALALDESATLNSKHIHPEYEALGSSIVIA